MPRTAEEVYDDIRARHHRGHSLDEFLPRYCQQALTWLERNRKISYMRDIVEFTAVAGTRTVTLAVSPSKSGFLSTLKAVSSLGWLGATGSWLPIEKQLEDDAYYTAEGLPGAFKIEGDTVTFPTIPDKAYVGQAYTWRYSIWPSTLAGTHPLLEFADDFIINHVMMQLAPQLNNPNLLAMYKVLRDDALQTVNNAQDEEEFPGPIEMQYSGSQYTTFEALVA